MSSTKTQESKLPQWQEDFIREQILPRGIEIADTEYTPYTGETIAGMTPTQQQALSGFGGLNMGGQAYGQAAGVQQGLTGFRPSSMGAEGQVDVNQLATTDLGAYMDPYTQNVIDLGQQDIERQRQMASNTLGAQAEAAGAFGGSRQAVQEGVLAGEALRQAGALSAQQRQQAFTQALQSSQFDIGNVQQAREAAAARAQAANAANFQGQFQGAGIQSAAANALGSLADQRLQSQLSGLGAQMSAGEQQRALEQAQLQSDYAMFQEQQGYPLTQLNALLAAGSGVPAGLGTTTTRDPFGGLTAVGNLLGGWLLATAATGYTALQTDWTIDMARLFTQEDIDRMKAMNKDMTGVEVGTLMLPNELEDLGYGSAAEDPAPEPVTAPVVEAAPVATSVTTPFAAQDTGGAATLQQLLAPQAAPATPTDPYANLSKTQRQMLAFSALSDAGAALAGRQGGNFNAMLGRFQRAGRHAAQGYGCGAAH